MGPKLLKAPSDLGKSLMADPGCLYKGDTEGRKHEPALALLQNMYELAQRLNSKQVFTPIDFDSPEAANDDPLADKFVELSYVIGPPYSSIPKEAWRAVIRLVEATPDARTHLPKFLAECFEPEGIKFAKFEICPFSHFIISAIPQDSGLLSVLGKRVAPAYRIEERVQFKVVNPKGENLGAFTMRTKCVISRNKKLSSDTSVVMDVGKTEIQIINDLRRDPKQQSYKCAYAPKAKEYKIYLEPPKAGGTSAMRRNITDATTTLLGTEDYICRIFDGAAGVEYTSRIFRGLLGPTLQVNPSDIDVVGHKTFLKQSKMARERSFSTSGQREQTSNVEKRAVIKSENGKYMHAVLRYNVVHRYESSGSCNSATKIDDLKFYVKIVADGRGNSLFLTKDEVDTSAFEQVRVKSSTELTTNAAWNDASTAQRCGYDTLAAKQAPAQYSASSQDQWCFVTEDLLEDSYGRYGAAHPDRPIITSKGVQRDTLNFLVSQAVYNEASQNVDPIPMDIERHFVSHRGLVSGNSINMKHEQSGSQHRVEEHFVLCPQGSKHNNTSLKVHAFVSYIVHGYDWDTSREKGRVALLGANAQLGMRFVNPQFKLDECLQVGNSSIDSGSFQVFDIALKGNTRIRCDKFRDAIGKIDIAKDGALFSPSQSRDGAGGKRNEEVKVADQGRVVFEQMARYYGAAASYSGEDGEHTTNNITGPLIPETRTLASSAIGKLLRLYDTDAIHVVGRGRHSRATKSASVPSSVRFAPCSSNSLSDLAQKRLKLLKLLETWIKEIGHQTHTSLFEATINLCGNFSHEGFTQFLLSQFQDYTRFPSKAAVVDKKLFLQFDQSTSEDGKPQDKIRVVQHALVAPMAWWQTENLHLVVCYDVCVAQLDNGLKQLQVTHPVAAVKLCSDTSLRAAKPYTSFQLERDSEFRIVKIPSNRVPAPAKALTVMQSVQDNFAGYKYLIQGTGESRSPGQQSVSEKMRACIVEFIGLHGIDKLMGSEHISTPDHTCDVLSQGYGSYGGGIGEQHTVSSVEYDEVVNVLSRANYDKFVRFFCTALGITRIDDKESGWEDVGTSVFKRHLPPGSGGGIAMTHELAFSAEGIVANTPPLNVKVAISYTLLYRGASDGKNLFVMGDPSVTVSMFANDGRELGRASLEGDALAVPLQAIIAVTSMRAQSVQNRHSQDEQFVRKLQDTAPQQKGADGDHVTADVSSEPAAPGATVMLSGACNDGSELADQTADDENQDEVLASKGVDAEPTVMPEEELGHHAVTRHDALSEAVEPVHDLSQDIAACLSAADQEVGSRTGTALSSDSSTSLKKQAPKIKRNGRPTAQVPLYDTMTAYDSYGESSSGRPRMLGHRPQRPGDDFPEVGFEPADDTAWYKKLFNFFLRIVLWIWAHIQGLFACAGSHQPPHSSTDRLYGYDGLHTQRGNARVRSHPKTAIRQQAGSSSVGSVVGGRHHQSGGRTYGSTHISYSGNGRTVSVSNGSEHTSHTPSTRSPGRRRSGNPVTVVDSATTDQLQRGSNARKSARM